MSASKIQRGTRVLGDFFPTTRVPNDDTATLSHVTHKTRRDRDANQRPQKPELTSHWAHATRQPPPRGPVTPATSDAPNTTGSAGLWGATGFRHPRERRRPAPARPRAASSGRGVRSDFQRHLAGAPRAPPPRAVVPTRQPPGAGSSGPPTAVRPFIRFSLGQTFRPSNLQSPVFPGAPVPSAASPSCILNILLIHFCTKHFQSYCHGDTS